MTSALGRAMSGRSIEHHRRSTEDAFSWEIASWSLPFEVDCQHPVAPCPHSRDVIGCSYIVQGSTCRGVAAA